MERFFETGNLHYHYQSHPDAYAGGYLSHSVFLDVGEKSDLIVIQELDAESGIIQRQALFVEFQLVEMLMFEKPPRNHWTGKFVKRISIVNFGKGAK